MAKIKVKTNESVIIEAIAYMYGKGIKEARRALEEGHYTREEIYEAIAWFNSYGLPDSMRRVWVKEVGLQHARDEYTF